MILSARTAFAALALSLAANGAQWLSARATSAEHAAELARIELDQATANAAAADQRASAIGVVALMTASDEDEIIARIEAATKRIERASKNYTDATYANPLPDDCRADAERVRAINAARGHEG